VFVIPKIVGHFAGRKPVIELGNLEVWREYGDVRSVASIYAKLLENPPIGETLNVCTGQEYSLQEVLGMCREITGHDMDVQVNPRFVRANEVRVLKGDNQRLTKVVGAWKSYTLRETLEWMLEDAAPAGTP
jgi:nucleoside-diphosphate-sugar epimerase